MNNPAQVQVNAPGPIGIQNNQMPAVIAYQQPTVGYPQPMLSTQPILSVPVVQNQYGPSPKYILPQNVPLNPGNLVQPAVVVPVSPYPQPAMAQGVPTYNQPPMAQPVPTYNQPPVAQPVPYAQPGPSQPYMPPPQPVTYPGQQIPPPYPQ